MKLPWYMREKLPVVLVAGLGGFFTVVDVACAQPWAASTAPPLPWKALAASADGTKIVAAANTAMHGPGPAAPVYISTNAGATWTQTSAPSNNWFSVACSADGTKLVAVASLYGPTGGRGDGLIYTSPDLGTTWTPTSAPSNTWSSVASSADGVRLVAVAAPEWFYDENGNRNHGGDGTIFSSLDSGASWTQSRVPTNYWTSVASSADGTRLVAVAAPQRVWDADGNWHFIGAGSIYGSLDSGATWTRNSAPSNNWSAVASSADGVKLVAVAKPYTDGDGNPAGDGTIYRSLDSGATWVPTSAPSNGWYCVASSAEGNRLVAASASLGDAFGPIYTSSDSGATWTATGAPNWVWTALASSADGYRVVAGGPLCTLPYSGPWRWADAPDNGWESVASSADGTKLVAAAGRWWEPGFIYTSTNSGATWRPTTAPSNCWHSVASSADGTKLAAVAWNGLIYTSINSGASWTPTTAPTNYWHSVASSADGTNLVAVTGYDGAAGGDGLVYASGNSGGTWTLTTAPSNNWFSVACSADGTKVVAAAFTYGGDGLIYRSSNSGATWTPTSAPSNRWSSVASSADGTKLVAGSYGEGDGLIYTSSNSGATWTPTSAPTHSWRSVASSADGTKLVAVGSSYSSNWDLIYISTNSGATWTPADAPYANDWSAVASSADGSNIVAVGGRPGICTLRTPAPAPPLPPSPQLAVGLSGATLGLSWLVPSTRFVLQQNSDLSSTNWVEVPTPPTLNYTNLHQRVTLTPSLGSSFYRLKQQ